MARLRARVPRDLLVEVDRLVTIGQYETRSHVLREAVQELLDRYARTEMNRKADEVYLRMPLTEGEFDWSDVDSLRIDGRDKGPRRGGSGST